MEYVDTGTGGTVFKMSYANFPMKKSLNATMMDIVKISDVVFLTLNLILSHLPQPHLLF